MTTPDPCTCRPKYVPGNFSSRVPNGEIVFCPLHEAAGLMRDALEYAVRNLGWSISSNDVDGETAYARARAALAAAEGRTGTPVDLPETCCDAGPLGHTGQHWKAP